MKDLISIAWRNIWRNKRRTAITIASIFFAVFFALIMRSMQLGTYGHMINQSIEKFSGYLQIQNPDYFDEPSLDNYLDYSGELIQTVQQTEGISIAVPRIEAFVLASSGHQSKGVMVTGIDPVQELRVSNPEHLLVKYRLTPEIVSKIINETTFDKKQIELLKFNENGLYHDLDRLALDLGLKPVDFVKYHPVFKTHAAYSGQYLKTDDDGVLVSSRLANYLRVDVGDSIILMGQGKFGATAAGIFPVKGLVKILSPDLDNKLVYMALPLAQEFLNMPNNLTYLVMNLTDNDQMIEVQKRLTSKLDPDKYVVKNWKEINPILEQQIESDNKSGQMFLGILYFIIFFGIIGTVLMMIAERKREFGVMVAIGMRKSKLILILVIEMLFMGIIGTAFGMLAVAPLIYYYNFYPYRFTGEMAKMYEDMGLDALMPAAGFDAYFAWQALIILLMVFLACYIPLRRIRKMKVMNALRG
jgi:ABC-type lipoprotein release transport system permease subunit